MSLQDTFGIGKNKDRVLRDIKGSYIRVDAIAIASQEKIEETFAEWNFRFRSPSLFTIAKPEKGDSQS